MTTVELRLGVLPPPMAIIAAAGIIISACCKYDDSALWNAVNDHENRIESLEQWQEQANGNIASLQQLVSTTNYITEVTPVMQGDKEIGYTISFLNSAPVTIYHGETPQISITQQDDGNWYWTLDGELLTDSHGNPLRVNDIVPRLSTGENLILQGITADAGNQEIVKEAIYLSMDDGKTWERISIENANSFFLSVDSSNEDYVIFTLADGATFNVPKYIENGIAFYMNGTLLTDLSEKINITNGNISYAVTGDGEVSVRILEGEGWSVEDEDGIFVFAGGMGIGSEALVEVTLLDNGKVIDTYRLIVTIGLSGSGTEKDPYIISSAEDLYYFGQQVNAGNISYSSGFFKMTGDISLPEPGNGNPDNWEPVSFPGTFDGGGYTFDGGGYTIKNMIVTEGNPLGYYGLFGILSGTVMNLNLESPVINIANEKLAFAGAIAGASTFDIITGASVCDIINCHVTGSAVISMQIGMAGGGIVGCNNASVTACSFTGEVSGFTCTGGVAGINSGNITACYASGNIHGSKLLFDSMGGSSVGGVVGSTLGAHIRASYFADGDVSGYDRVGGVIGGQSGGSASACYWSISPGAAGGNPPQYGIGDANGTDENDVNGTDENAIKVTDESGWASAMTAMNSALAGSGWIYETNNDGDFPLIIVRN